ncbi:hypothetical protein FY034_18880 (plasmid) [Trichlorobacter lovleyi]|uniref:hypothetical protein n=1 Tax=Trichlorobacter lovleyi TaxID=313985 RepID=UPI00223F28CE|nr:hypothetical protein [Trichlorobacter lovleyi]QOX81043.1 hypothetical protein FY034_18880 [Trichlorobacter lovleyi]
MTFKGWLFSFLVTLVATPLINGFVMSVLWKWFLVPKFGFPVINWAMTAGISLIFQFVKGVNISGDNAPKTDAEGFILVFLRLIVAPLLGLLIGYVLKSYAV